MKKNIMNIYEEDEIYPYDIDTVIYNGSPVNVIREENLGLRI